MHSSESKEPRRSSAATKLYRAAFQRRCHELLAIAYATMDSASFQNDEETVITGEIVLAMNETLESSDAPSWAARFVVLDDPPVNAPGRTGKRRRRVDVEVVKTQRGVRPRMHFEAKRLHTSDSVAVYLGPDGMGLFLDGAYAAGHADAGMWGYVQVGEPRDWADKIEKKLCGSRAKYRVRDDGDFRRESLTPALDSTYRSRHDRPTVGEPITIFHTFLRFN